MRANLGEADKEEISNDSKGGRHILGLPLGFAFYYPSPGYSLMEEIESGRTSLSAVLKDKISSYVIGDPFQNESEKKHFDDIWRTMLTHGDSNVKKSYLDGFVWMHTEMQDAAFDAIKAHYESNKTTEHPKSFRDFVYLSFQQMWKDRDPKRKQNSFELYCALEPRDAFRFASKTLKDTRASNEDRLFLFQFLNINRSMYFDPQTTQIIGYLLADLNKTGRLPEGIDALPS